MAYLVNVPRRAQKDLAKIDGRYRNRILVSLVHIGNDPYIGKKLDGDRKGQWSYRVWPYRIIYEIHKHELVVLVLRIGHRQGGVLMNLIITEPV